MLISLNEIKKLVPEAKKVDTKELIKLIGARLVEVEGSADLAPKYAGIKIVKVIECEAIPETHLHVCKINVGKKDLIQVVCGAPNVHKDMLAVWIAPGCIVPETYGEGKENFKLSVRPLRGFESHGMLAALDELDLGEDHEGIVEINPAQKYTDASGKTQTVKPGDAFAEVFDLNDVILDIENKSLTHRPDTFGLIGFAREVAGILGAKFEEPSINFDDLKIDQNLTASTFSDHITDSERVTIEVQDEKLCPKYSADVFAVSATGQSDALEKSNYLTPNAIFLAKAGMRTINKIVDATNVTMLLTGQPLHAFDYDKFKAVGGGGEPKIIVRAAKDGEKIKLLDGNEIELNNSDIVICSSNTPVALAGAMGGESTEIDENTKKIILESATFSLYNLRKTQMAHGIFSEAITRFTKGQPVSGVVPALARCSALLLERPSQITDFEISEAYNDEDIFVEVYLEDINDLLGTDYPLDTIINTLNNVGIKLVDQDEGLRFRIPSWRTDIHIKEDIIEEVGRLLGYDNIKLDYPTRPFVGASRNKLLDLKAKLRDLLSGRFVAHELLTYSFVSHRLQENVGENPEDSYEIVNSISPELQRFRQSLVPSLLEKISVNLKAGFRDFSVYEINQVSKISFGKDEDGVPVLKNHLAFATTGDYYAAKTVLLDLLSDLGIKNPEIKQFENKAKNSAPYCEPFHSANVVVKSANNTLVISLGEIKSSVLKRLKIGTAVSVFELDLDNLLKMIPSASATAAKISKFPSVERDLTIKVANDVAYDDCAKEILNIFKAKNLIISIEPTSIYQADKSTKNISFHLRFASSDKTLENAEISDIMNEISVVVGKSLKAQVV